MFVFWEYIVRRRAEEWQLWIVENNVCIMSTSEQRSYIASADPLTNLPTVG